MRAVVINNYMASKVRDGGIKDSDKIRTLLQSKEGIKGSDEGEVGRGVVKEAGMG